MEKNFINRTIQSVEEPSNQTHKTPKLEISHQEINLRLKMRKVQSFYGDSGEKKEILWSTPITWSKNIYKKKNIYIIGVLERRDQPVLSSKGKQKLFHTSISSVVNSDKRSFCNNNKILQEPRARVEYIHIHSKAHFVRLINQCSKLIRKIILFSFWHIKMNSILDYMLVL